MNDDKKLAERLKKHDEKELSDIIGEYAPFVSTIIRNISNGQLKNEDIEEVITDVFVTLWRNSDRLETDKLKAYIICITKSRTKDRLKRKQSGDTVNIDEVFAISSDDDIFEKCENDFLYEELNREVEKISEPDREILIRYYYYYQSIGKISEIMSISEGTVKSKLHRTRRKLKKILTERGYNL